MLLTITAIGSHAADLSYLLHKHPDKLQIFPLSVGKAHVFYPEFTQNRCTVALLLNINPIDLIRHRRGPAGEGFVLRQYVNNRPYAASSFLSSAILRAFRTAMNGQCKDKPEAVTREMPFEVNIAALPVRGGEKLLENLFTPLGYDIKPQTHLLDNTFPEWGNSHCYTVVLKHQAITLQALLSHLYVLIPVMDNDKHYWISKDEVEKLLQKGAGWLQAHPHKALITRRYLKRLGHLTRLALERLADDAADEDEQSEENEPLLSTTQKEKKASLNQIRLSQTVAALKEHGAKTILDLGCGEGKLLKLLLRERQFEKILGMDVSIRALTRAKERLYYDEMSPRQRQRIELMQGSLLYRDKRLEGYDGAAVVEVIEHMDLPRLAAFSRVIFQFARPGVVVITTPNREYNRLYETLPAGKFRHSDHRFEWTRPEFQNWANEIAGKYGYAVKFLPVGPEDAAAGSSTQMGVFTCK